MVETEKFSITTSVPGYVLKPVDEKVKELGIKRSAYIEKLLIENLPKIERLLKQKNTKDITITLPIELIDEIKQLEEKYQTTAGRIIYLALLIDFCSTSQSPLPHTTSKRAATSLPSFKKE